jgi:hypothetical protein
MARAIVAICGYGLRDYRALWGKYGSLFGRDAWRLRGMRAIHCAAWLVGIKKAPSG